MLDELKQCDTDPGVMYGVDSAMEEESCRLLMNTLDALYTLV